MFPWLLCILLLFVTGVLFFLSLPSLYHNETMEPEDKDLLQRIQLKKQERQQNKETLLQIVQNEMKSM